MSELVIVPPITRSDGAVGGTTARQSGPTTASAPRIRRFSDSCPPLHRYRRPDAAPRLATPGRDQRNGARRPASFVNCWLEETAPADSTWSKVSSASRTPPLSKLVGLTT